jgi:hypothetical protein
MIIAENSILRDLPKELGERDLLIFDAIRFTIDIINNNWEILNEQLLHHSIGGKKNFIRIFNEVWSIIDNVYRFKKFYKLLPSKSNHQILEAIPDLHPFRNTLAHLDDRINESLLKTNSAFYGSLTWIYRNDTIRKNQTLVAVSGIVQNNSKQFFQFETYDESSELIYGIKLQTVNKYDIIEISISDLILSLIQVIKTIEEGLETTCQHLDKMDWRHLRDILLIFNNEDEA